MRGVHQGNALTVEVVTGLLRRHRWSLVVQRDLGVVQLVEVAVWPLVLVQAERHQLRGADKFLDVVAARLTGRHGGQGKTEAGDVERAGREARARRIVDPRAYAQGHHRTEGRHVVQQRIIASRRPRQPITRRPCQPHLCRFGEKGDLRSLLPFIFHIQHKRQVLGRQRVASQRGLA